MQNETYTVNSPNIGNVMYRKDNLTGQYENFTYDNLDRLTGITYMTQPLQSIAYSGNGNITSKYNGGTYAYDATKVHAVTSVTKSHGTASQPLQDITYTKFNKAETVIQKTTGPVIKTLSYNITYGPDEQRVKTINSDSNNVITTRFYSGSYQKDSTNGTSKKIHYIMGATGLVAVYITWSAGQDSMFYVCTDRQGSITALLKQNGTVSERYSYDAYGRRRNPANWADYNVKAPRLISRGYTGHEHLDGFGLLNMNGRMYDPVIGRVLSPDAFVQAPGYTQSYNRYSYCMNNPLRYTDPSGWYMMLSNGSIVGQDFNDWGVANSAELWMPGSGGHWTDENRSVYGNYMLMGANVFQSYYGISKEDYNNKIVPNYQGLPHSRHDFIRNHDGQIGFFAPKQYGLGSVKNDGLNAGAAISGIGVGVRFVYIGGTQPGGDDPYQYMGSQDRAYSMSEFINKNKGLTREQIINQMDNKSKTFLNSMQGGPFMRYVRNPHDGRILDMRHMLIVGKLPPAIGNLVEVGQWVIGQESGMHPQDFYSNGVGYQFYMQYNGFKNFFNPVTFTNQLQDFFYSPRIIINH